MNITVVFFIVLLCLIVTLLCVEGYKTENDARRKRSDNCSSQQYKQNISLCHTADLTVVPFSDSEKKSIVVSFSLNDHVTFADCFPYYDMFLRKDGVITEGYKLSSSSFVGNNYSHTFLNVSPGLYRIDIQPCYSYSCCANLTIYYPDLINITSFDILSHTLKVSTGNNVNPIAVSIGLLAAAVLLITICWLYYYYFGPNFKHSNVDQTDSIKEDSIPEKTVVYILHYYDDFNVNKRKANILKDFLKQSCLYDSVKTIDDELSVILFSVHKWLKSVLKERDKEGKIQKIILIDSKEEDEVGAIENLIFNDFLAMLNDNLIQYLSSYDNLFVVQFGNISGFCEQLKNVVRRHRYSIPKHSVDLGINLCSIPDSKVSSVKKYLHEIYTQHPVRHLGLFDCP